MNRLKTLMKEQDISLNQLTYKTQIGKQKLKHIIAGDNLVTLYDATLIANVLKADIDDIFPKEQISKINRNQALYHERIQQGLKSHELAKMAGLSKTMFGNIERRERKVTPLEAERIARALGVSVGSLFLDGVDFK